MDKLDQLLEALDHPERLSDSQLLKLLEDSEVKRLYILLNASRSKEYLKETKSENVDIEKQWTAFKKKNRNKGLLHFLFARKAAVATLLLVISCSIIMVGISRQSHNNHAIEKRITAGPDTLPAKETADSKVNHIGKDTVIIFEDEDLLSILETVAPYYHVSVGITSPALKETRLFLKWESSLPLPDFIEHLNSFERINLSLRNDTITNN